MTVKKNPAGYGTRDKILMAASRMFADHGYDGCSLREIADQAKVNVGMIHYFFGTKQALLRESFVQAGASLATIDSLSGIVSPRVLGSFALLGLFALVPVLYGRFKGKKCDSRI